MCKSMEYGRVIDVTSTRPPHRRTDPDPSATRPLSATGFHEHDGLFISIITS